MLNKEDIKQKLLEKRTELVRYGVKRLGIFCSFARNVQKPGSDLDVMVE
jgi:predicted nucleotidyltransferase